MYVYEQEYLISILTLSLPSKKIKLVVTSQPLQHHPGDIKGDTM